MGGGAAIRSTAARAVAYAGYRSSAARKPPSFAAASSQSFHVAADPDSQMLISADVSGAPGAAAVAVHSPSWANEDWDFVTDSGLVVDPPPRVVFGPAPTWEEAKEATSDLKEAMEKVYFSAPVPENSFKASQVSNYVKSEAILPAPKSIVQAFELLKGSSEAQDIVASIASDKNVWEAVLKNEKIVELRNKYQLISPRESVGENEIPERSSESVESPEKETSEGSFFSELVENVRVKVTELISNISDFFQDFMGPSSDTSGKDQTDPNTSNSIPFGEFFGPLMGLAVLVMMVVLLKRG